MKQGLRYTIIFLFLFILVLATYLVYLLVDYKRLPDKQGLAIVNQKTSLTSPKQTYQVTSFNIGYAAYPADYTFFMDGGKYSRAYSQENVLDNLSGIANTLETLHSDAFLLQEVDTWAHRSYKINEVAYLSDALPTYHYTFGQNYDSIYLFYPITRPIGRSQSGLLTLSLFPLEKSTRFSLPIETNFNKYFDLDRAFTVTQTTFDHHPITLINVHLSAFTKDTSVLDAQIKKLAALMTSEYEAGRSVIVGGDFNHDLLGNSPAIFETSDTIQTWTQPFPENLLPDHFSIAKTGLVEAKIPSVRENGVPYDQKTSFVSLIDGFLVSDNLEVQQVVVSDLEFANSDHNPVTLKFTFKSE